MSRTPPSWLRRRRRDAQWWAGQGWLRLGRALPERRFLQLGAALAERGASFAPRLRRRTIDRVSARLGVTVAAAEEITAGMLRHFGTMAAELAIFDRLLARLEEEVQLSEADAALLRAQQRDGGGLIVAAGHVGNWELMAARLALVVHGTAVFARAPADPRWARWVTALRARGGVRTLARGSAVAPWRSLRRDGAAVGLLVDRSTVGASLRVPFFGSRVAASTAPARLHRATGWPVVVATCARRPGGGHRVSVDPIDPGDDVAVTTQIHARLEARIRAHPEGWIWFHDRWADPPG